jgi:hypothetical protein
MGESYERLRVIVADCRCEKAVLFLLQSSPDWGSIYLCWTWRLGALQPYRGVDMMRCLFTTDWTAPAPSAVPSFSHHLAMALASFAFAITVHAGAVVLGV